MIHKDTVARVNEEQFVISFFQIQKIINFAPLNIEFLC